MRRQLVRSRGIVVTVDLGQDHVRRIGLILNDIETHCAGLGQQGPCIDPDGGTGLPAGGGYSACSG